MPRILLVDDDEAIQEALGDLIRVAGHEVETCGDGAAVHRRLLKGGIDIVVLDVLIPHKNGFTVLDELRGDPNTADIPVIMMSGIYRSRNHRREMIDRHGIVEYLDKPVAPGRLVELIEGEVGAGHPTGELPLDELTTSPLDISELSDIGYVEPEADAERKEVESASRKKFVTNPFVLQGSLKRNPIPSVLGRMWANRRSGGLLIKRGRIKKIIYVRDGAPYAVKSNVVAECLGQLLVRERLISEDECRRSVAEMKKTGTRQGEILISMGTMTAKNLDFALELQLEKKLFEAFAWDQGEFRFNSSTDLPPESVSLEWPGAAAIVEGIRRAFDETRLRGIMVPVMDMPLRWGERQLDPDELKLSATERRAVEGLELPNSVGDLVQDGELPPAEMLRVVYTLVALMLLEPAG